MAAGRYTSQATNIGVLPFLSFRNLASFAENVVLPEPWSPDIKMIEGFEERLIPSASLPIN